MSLATHGADQLIVQRYLCAKSQASAGWALVLSGFVVFVQFALFLFIGVELACFHETVEPTDGRVAGDQAFMSFVVEPHGDGAEGADSGGDSGGDDVDARQLVQFVGQLADERLAGPAAGGRRRAEVARTRAVV